MKRFVQSTLPKLPRGRPKSKVTTVVYKVNLPADLVGSLEIEAMARGLDFSQDAVRQILQEYINNAHKTTNT